jgi:hypothetical protein
MPAGKNRRQDGRQFKRNQEKANANLKKLKEDIKTNQAMMDVNLKEMREEIPSGQAEMRSIVNAWIVDMKADRRQTMSCHVTTAVCLDSNELNPEDVEIKVQHREVPTEEAAVKSSGTMKKRHRGRHQAAGRRREPKELTRGESGSRRKLAAACRKVSRRGAVARRKRNVFKKI